MILTGTHQNKVEFKSPILVGFFLAGLITHGGLQGWWIAPVLGSLSELPLMLTATVLTAFNDNAAITYLATLVPNLADASKYAVVAGAVTGGGLTVIANAPNPAGQSILGRFFTTRCKSWIIVSRCSRSHNNHGNLFHGFIAIESKQMALVNIKRSKFIRQPFV